MSFKNKVVLITGASSGIGATTAISFAKEGANVAMVGRNKVKLDTVAKQCEAVGNKPLVIIADVSNDDDAKRLIKETIDKLGKLNVLINNAGFARTGSILTGNLVESYDEIMATNVRAVMNLTVLATPYLAETKGNIVNVSSIAALRPPIVPKFNAYGVSKAALDHFSRGAALELAPKGIRVNIVSPGPVETDFGDNVKDPAVFEEFERDLPMGRGGVPQEVADLIIFLASDKARSMTGSLNVTDNGVLLKR